MITDADVKKLEKKFATKVELKNELNKVEIRLNKRIDRLSKEIDHKLEPLMEFKEEFTSFKGSVLKTLDWLVSAFTKFNDEHSVLTEQNNRTRLKIENHEDRIVSLEQRIATP